MRQHKISRADVARVIAGVVASGDDQEDEKQPEPGVWQTDENDLPKVPWAQAQAFRTKRGAHNKLLLEAREADVFKRVVPVEDRADFLRDLVMKSESDVPLSRDSGYHILSQRCIGVSRRDWAAFLKKQAVLQRTQNIPVERRKGGIKIEARGHLEMDLIEGKKKDVVVTFLTDDWYWLSVCDVLTGLLIVKRLNNKEAGTTAQALADVLTEFRQALGAPLLSVSSDQGSEFKGAVTRLLKRRNVAQKFVDRASRIEQQNAIFQRNFYRLYKLRRGTFHSLETQALRLVNNTRNKYTRMTPNEAVAAPDADIAPRYNTAREQSEENYRAVTINQGDRVRHLRNIRKRIRGIGYKAYRGDHWSKEVRHVASKKRIGAAFKYLVSGKWYDRDALQLVPAVDAASDAIVTKRRSDQDKKHVLWE